MSADPLRLTVVLPANSRFGPSGAGSIDLCVHDYVRRSRHRDAITVLAPSVEAPFPGVDLVQYAFRRQIVSRRLIETTRPDIVLVHHDVWSARRIAARHPDLPVVMCRHNDIRPGASRISAWRRSRRLRRLAGLVFVSENDRRLFRETWPHSATPAHVVHNGLAMSEWVPQAQRRPEIIFAGRADANKGGLALARALRRALPAAPDWRARLFLSGAQRWPERVAQIRETLAPLGARVEIRTDRPHSEVKAAFCEAAIAVTPTQRSEAFGRTALEAMAGGAALVTSAVGALTEVTGDCALVVDRADADALERAVLRLAGDERLRARLAAAGRRRAAERFDLDPLAAKMDDLLEAHVRRHAARRPAAAAGAWRLLPIGGPRKAPAGGGVAGTAP